MASTHRQGSQVDATNSSTIAMAGHYSNTTAPAAGPSTEMVFETPTHEMSIAYCFEDDIEM